MTKINKNHLRLLMAGLAAGDSLGSTSEFQGPAAVARTYAAHEAAGWPFRQVGGGPFGWAKGDPTDDTDMALCIVRAVAARGGEFDPGAVADEFAKWLGTGPRDVGGTTARALSRRRGGAAWLDCGYEAFLSNPGNSANGSLMRNGVITALSADLGDVLRYTVQQAVITHYDPLSVLCCCAQSFLVYGLLRQGRGGAPAFEADDPGAPWLGRFADAFGRWVGEEADPAIGLWLGRVGSGSLDAAWGTLRAADFSASFDPFDARWRSVGQGYSVLTLQTAVWALRWAILGRPYPNVPPHLPPDPFLRLGADVLGWVALIGRDSDTYGAAAGPLVAAALGGLPSHLIDGLRAVAETGRLLGAVEG